MLPRFDEQLSQGDLLVSTDPSADLLMVMTTDCDLARDKHHGRLTCLGLWPMERYLSEFVLSRLVKKATDQFEDRLVGAVNKLRTTAGGSALTSERVLEWVAEVPVEQVLKVLDPHGGAPEKLHAKVRTHLGELPAVRNKPELFCDQVAWLTRTWSALGQISEPAAGLRRIRERVDAFVASPPGDVYLLSEVSPEHRVGYAVALRFPIEIRIHDVQLTPLAAAGRPKYRRITTICTPYVFSIAQQFAAVFSAIGTPDDQKESVKLAAAILLHDLLPETPEVTVD
jgi:hypothetical protein